VKHGRSVWLAAALAFLFVGSSFGQEQHFYRISSDTTTVITAISPDGWLSWSNAALGATVTIERATSMLGSNVWTSYVQHPVTSVVMRLRCFAPSPPEGMVFIPAGSNRGTDPDFGAYNLTVDSFYMDRYEVTQDLWFEVKYWNGGNGYGYHPGAGGGSKGTNHPVQAVNWYDCVKWCNARSEKEGRTPVYYMDSGFTQVYKKGEVFGRYVKESANGYRLPTEVQWEYAARGGAVSRCFPWRDTDTIQHTRANYYSSSSYTGDTSATRGYHPDWNDTYPHTSPVGTFESGKNGYGLYDLAGNVDEWCYDCVIRGGSWKAQGYECRVAWVPYSPHTPPDRSSTWSGFRTCLSPGQ
jgi:sulfatase modifying factor 1